MRRVRDRALWGAAATLIVVLIVGCASTALRPAQRLLSDEDLANAVVGTWKGEVYWQGMLPSSAMLVIKSIREKEGRRVIEAEWQFTRVSGTINITETGPLVEFFDPGYGGRVFLRLEGEYLRGRVQLRGSGGDRDVRLKKVTN